MVSWSDIKEGIKGILMFFGAIAVIFGIALLFALIILLITSPIWLFLWSFTLPLTDQLLVIIIILLIIIILFK